MKAYKQIMLGLTEINIKINILYFTRRFIMLFIGYYIICLGARPIPIQKHNSREFFCCHRIR